MRWVQLTLVENDPGRFDPQFWLDYFRRLHADAATLSAGGIVAYYPTEIPLHHRSAWLGDSDPFGTLVAGCRALGMRVVARTDPHAVRDDVRAAHPDWISTTRDGKPLRHWANPDLWVTCALGPYNFEFMDQRPSRDRGEVQGRRRLRQPLGAARRRLLLRPLRAEFQGGDRRSPCRERPTRAIPARRAVSRVAQDATDRALEEVGRDACARPIRTRSFIPNGPPDLKTAGELAAIQFTDNQARRGVTPPWNNGRRAKELRSVMGRRPIGGIFSVGLEEPYRWKDSVQSEPEIRLWVAEGTANGMRPWVTKFSGVLYDRRWLQPVERIYQWHFEHERYLRNETPLARVALLHSEQTAAYHPGVGDGRSRRGPHARDVSRAGRSAHPVRAGPRSVADAGSARSVQAADPRGRARRSPTRNARRSASYVSRGGSVLATFATSLYDESGPAARGLRPGRSVRRVVRRADRGSDAELVSRASTRIRDRRRGTRFSKGWKTRRGSSTACSASPSVRRGDFPSPLTLIPTLSRSADGGRLSARRAHGHARAVSARRSGTAASSTFPGTSTARSGTSCASTTCGCCETRSVGGERTAAGRSRRTRACSTSPRGGSATR